MTALAVSVRQDRVVTAEDPALGDSVGPLLKGGQSPISLGRTVGQPTFTIIQTRCDPAGGGIVDQPAGEEIREAVGVLEPDETGELVVHRAIAAVDVAVDVAETRSLRNRTGITLIALGAGLALIALGARGSAGRRDQVSSDIDQHCSHGAVHEQIDLTRCRELDGHRVGDVCTARCPVDVRCGWGACPLPGRIDKNPFVDGRTTVAFRITAVAPAGTTSAFTGAALPGGCVGTLPVTCSFFDVSDAGGLSRPTLVRESKMRTGSTVIVDDGSDEAASTAIIPPAPSVTATAAPTAAQRDRHAPDRTCLLVPMATPPLIERLNPTPNATEH